MKAFLSFSLMLGLLGLSVSLNAYDTTDQRSADAEQRRLDDTRQDQKIQDRKLEDQYYQDRRQEQKIIDRQLEKKRIEQRRIDNQRKTQLIADRGRGSRDRNHFIDRSERDDQDLMDDTVDERFLENNHYRNEQYNNNNQHENEPQAGDSCPNCKDGGKSCLNCKDRKAVTRLEETQQHDEENHKHRKEMAEQWLRNNPRG